MTPTLKTLIGDVMEKLPELPDGSVHCVVTSPPYWGLRDYSRCQCVRFIDGEDVASADCVRCAGTGHDTEVQQKQLGMEKTPQEFVARMVAVFREVRRILRHDGVCWINIADSYATGAGAVGECPGVGEQGERARQMFGYRGGRKHDYLENNNLTQPNRMPIPGLKAKDLCLVPARLAIALQEDGWYVRSEIIWHKPNVMPSSVTDRPTTNHEYIFLLTKSPHYFYDHYAIMEHVSGTANARGNGMNPKARENGKENKQDQVGKRQHTGFNERCKNKQNESFSSTVTGLVSKRNKRTVWTVPTFPYSGSHYATFPPDLIKPCVLAGTSEKGCCSACGAPYERIVEKERTFESGSGRSGNLPTGKNGEHMQGGGETHDIRRGPTLHVRDSGWKPTCQCQNASIIPCTVMDPFLGSGTTATVALEYGRSAIGIELNPANIGLIQERTQQTGFALP